MGISSMKTGSMKRSLLVGNVAYVPAVRGLFGGGSSSSDVIQYINISSTGNATSFGTLITAGYGRASCSSSTRGLWGGGGTSGGGGTKLDSIEYVTIASTGNGTNFGSLTQVRNGVTGLSNSTRGLFGGGLTGGSGTYTNIIDYVTIASTGNATDFGDLYRSTQWVGACASPTRGIFAGGQSEIYSNDIGYVTISSTGNTTDFGDLTVARGYLSGCSSSTRGLIAGGHNTGGNVIDYFTIATTGNATSFGNLSGTKYGMGATSSSTRGVFGGGYDYTSGEVEINVIDYVTIASTGNATAFGNLLAARGYVAACSEGHGGLA